MPIVQNLESKGRRRLMEEWFGIIGAPCHYKYITPMGSYLSFRHLAHLGATNYRAAAYDDAAIQIDDRADNTTDHNPLAPEGTAYETNTRITPFVIHKAEQKYFLKNNESTPANITIFHVQVKQPLPINNVSTVDSDTLAGNQVLRLITEGIADPLSFAAVQTSGAVMQHVTTNGTANQGFPWETTGQIDEASFKPQFTIFDSKLFTQMCHVKNVHMIKLKPGDSADYTVQFSPQAFPDGVEVFTATNGEVTAYPFTEMVLFQCRGDVGHTSSYSYTSGLEAAASASSNRRSGRKQVPPAVVGFDSCCVDVVMHFNMDIEVFDGDLIEPMDGINILTTIDANEMAGPLEQTVHDLQA